MQSKSLLMLVAAAGLVCLSACGRGVVSPLIYGDGIVNGKPVANQDIVSKSVVALVAEGADGQSLCTGSVVNEETILTAAHCVEGEPRRIAVIFNPKVSGVDQGVVRMADRFLQNPRWNISDRRKDRGDLALVHFSGGLPAGYQPVAFLTEKTPLTNGATVILAGYGVTSGKSSKGAGTLREAPTTIEGQFSNTEIMTDGRTSSVCFGDSGGPAFIQTENGLVQWGVASSVMTRACNEASVHTSLIGYETWVERAAKDLARSPQG